ncbi:hypothetical protein [Chryseobacterium sp. HSC-36S06]|uniref:hypothetical protein n=1 Tax=Chryseobacterium sp. HSC-36S06 TaxID=2910970 RepID=UPI00209EDA88|nr:hypothetical protein [Chryseobacterium sp. HSC-36S06]MCP2037697.1 hypothetical protein [Chryseobacterium sp. HSC-36S06]
MRNFIFIMCLMLSGEFFSQAMPDNRFDNGNEQIYEQQQKLPVQDDYQQDPQQLTNNTGQPGDPVPIDDYLPVLLITAVGIIVHAGWRKRKQTA